MTDKLVVRWLLTGRIPTRNVSVELYHGEYIKPVDIFIRFDSVYVFDTPLLDVGRTDLYFTVCPSPYLAPKALREILYDHIDARSLISNCTSGSPGYPVLENMKSFYIAPGKQPLSAADCRWHANQPGTGSQDHCRTPHGAGRSSQKQQPAQASRTS